MNSDENDKKQGRTRARGGTRRNGGKPREGAVGSALRTAYDDAVSEPIPAEMLDLLGKLS